MSREARRRKLAGVQQAQTCKGRYLAAQILRAIQRRKPGEAFTAEDLRASVRLVPGPANAWGAAFHHAARLGLVWNDGFRRCTRPESHARIVAVWRRA